MEKGYSPIFDIDMFPQKIMGFKYPGDIQPFIKKIRKMELKYPNDTEKPLDDRVYSIMDRNILQTIKKFFPVRDYIENLVKVHSNLDVKITSSWLNIYKKGGYTTFHSHIPNFLAGVFYLKVPLTHPGLDFYSKLAIPQLLYNVNPQPGDILIFDGDQPHSSPPNPTDEEKIVIAFNIGR